MTARERLLRGERLRVRIAGGGGFVFLRRADGEFVYDCHEGWAAGVVEPICFRDSDYLERSFLAKCSKVEYDAGGRWAPV